MAGSALFDRPRFARQMEAAYRALWTRFCEEDSATPRIGTHVEIDLG